MRGDAIKITVTIDDELLARASELTGETERSALLRAGLTTLIRVEGTRRLAALEGSGAAATGGWRRRGVTD